MNFLEIITTYQTLIGTFLGPLLAIFSSIMLWSLRNYFERKKQTKDDKKEIEKIFLMASRECSDSIDDLKGFIEKSKEVINKSNNEINSVLPSKFNKIYINQERLFSLSRNLHHVISQQIDVAVSDAKKFNSWLETYERLPELIFNSYIDALKCGLKTKEDALKEHSADWSNFISDIEKTVKEKMNITQLRLLRPVLATTLKDKELEKMMASGHLDEILENQAKAYFDLNEF